MRQRLRGKALAISGAVLSLTLCAAAMAPAADASSGPVITGGGCAVEFGTYFISCHSLWMTLSGPYTHSRRNGGGIPSTAVRASPGFPGQPEITPSDIR